MRVLRYYYAEGGDESVKLLIQEGGDESVKVLIQGGTR